MSRNIPEEELKQIETVVQSFPAGVTIRQIEKQLATSLTRRTLQYRLKYLVDAKRLVRQGEKRGTKYFMYAMGRNDNELPSDPVTEIEAGTKDHVPLSNAGKKIQKYVVAPLAARKPVGYERSFLDSYRPNVSGYLSKTERAHLHTIGASATGEQAAGTYAKHILNRLLIDLSWNSSRLEGNTYSLLDTKRLINLGEEAAGKASLDAQMILNHKEAIEFLVSSADEIGFNRYTILNLHALLANNLLSDPNAMGRLRHIVVGIEKSAFYPLEVPQLIEECFDQILATASAIKDPFEQSFFAMIQLPYLQAFDDVNKRVSRMAANIPLIKGNLSPLSFTDVSTALYTEAILGVYELNQIDLLKDVFIWAYERSAFRYAAVRQSLGEPDLFRIRHREALREIIGDVIRGKMGRHATVKYIAAWIKKNITDGERNQFKETAENELVGMHDGNFARYQIRPSEFQSWQCVWNGASPDYKRG